MLERETASLGPDCIDVLRKLVEQELHEQVSCPKPPFLAVCLGRNSTAMRLQTASVGHQACLAACCHRMDAQLRYIYAAQARHRLEGRAARSVCVAVLSSV